ncbi:MAG: CocE/NonD family hydrolase, partial [Planctomycetes bacterium]|nr:CocE/NonD family hydrolase [Planctomycetota bacterium]
AGLQREIYWRYAAFPHYLESLRWEDALFHLPLNEMDELLGETLPFWDDCLQNPSFNHFWESFSLSDLLPGVEAAILHIGGWYNSQDLGGTVTNFRILQDRDDLKGLQGRQRLVMGPWSQGINSETSLGFCDFSPSSHIDEQTLLVEWFSRWLKGSPQAEENNAPPVSLFLLGKNEWIGLSGWPPPGSRYRSYFLHSTGQAGRNWEQGLLSTVPPSGFEEIDFFVSDPSDPVMAELLLGTDDQRPVERRDDVLTFTTPQLKADLPVVGTPQVVLYVNTSVADTDLFVMITDVDEFGFSRPVSHGAMRARFRDSFRMPKPLSPADIVEYVIDLTPCANCFLEGHAIRLNVMGSYFPYLTRNLNTGSPIGDEKELQRAPVFLIHDFEFSSRVILPVLP